MTIVLFSYCITTLQKMHASATIFITVLCKKYKQCLSVAKTNRDVVVFFCIANVFDLLLSSKDVYSFKCLFANNLNQYITSWSKSPFRWLNGNESISWRHRKCFSKLCVHRMRTKTPNWCADLVKRPEMFENQHVTSYKIFKILPD